jgi:predicted PurR-regulated permease PerM
MSRQLLNTPKLAIMGNMQPERNFSVNISNRTQIRAILWVLLAVVAYHSIGRVAHILTLIFLSFFLALTLNPIVGWMTHRLKIASRVRATAVSYLLIVLILGGFFALVTPPLVNQSRQFIQNVPSIVANFQTQNSTVARIAREHHVDQRLTDAARTFASHYSNFGSTILDTTKRVVGALISALIVIVMTFMMLVEGPRWFKLIISNLPKSKQARYSHLASRMYRTVSGFALGQVILATIAATACGIALLIASNLLKVSINPVALAGIVALFGLIPMLGNPISSTIVVLVCLLNSPALALVMLIYFIIYYQIENYTLQPYIQSRQNALTPLLVFLAALLGIALGGIIGALAAIPVAGCIKILLEDHFGQAANKTTA